MAQNRRRRRSHTSFRAWGTVLATLLVGTLLGRHWLAATWVALLLVFYVGAVRITLCRVETLRHRPCRWRVRGFLRTCDFHVGLKRGLPILVSSDYRLTLPMLMWPRSDLDAAGYTARAEPQPAAAARGRAALAANQRGGGADRAMLWLGIAGLLVALASFIRDLLAGMLGGG
jgi:hypothetical protein